MAIIEGPFRFIVGVPDGEAAWPPMYLLFKVGANDIEKVSYFEPVIETWEDVEVLGPYLTRYTQRTRAESRRIMRSYQNQVYGEYPQVSSPLIHPVEVSWASLNPLNVVNGVSGGVKLYMYRWLTNANALPGLIHAFTEAGDKVEDGLVSLRDYATNPTAPFDYAYEVLLASRSEPPPLILKNTGVTFAPGVWNFTVNNIMDSAGIVVQQTLVSTEPGNSYRITEQDNTEAMYSARSAECEAMALEPDPDVPFYDVVFNETMTAETETMGGSKVHRIELVQDEMEGAGWVGAVITAIATGDLITLYTPSPGRAFRNLCGIDPPRGIPAFYSQAGSALLGSFAMPAWTYLPNPYMATNPIASTRYDVLPGYTVDLVRMVSKSNSDYVLEYQLTTVLTEEQEEAGETPVSVWVEVFKANIAGLVPDHTFWRRLPVGSEQIHYSYVAQDLIGDPVPLSPGPTTASHVASRPYKLRRV